MRMIPLALVLLAATLLPGCLESSDTVVLKLDGSGTVASTYVTDVQKFTELAEQGRMMFFPDADTSVLPDPFAEVWFRLGAAKSDGFEITKFEAANDDKKRTAKVTTKFTSLEAAAKGGAFFSSAVNLSLIDFEVPGDTTGGDGERPKVKAWKLSLKDAVAQEYNGMRPADILPMFEAQLDTLRIVRSVTLPTRILDTNGKKSEDGTSVSWTVDYGMIQEGEDLEMMVVFACDEDLVLEPFSFSPDMRAMAPRFLEPPPKMIKTHDGDGDEDDGDG